MPLCGGTLLVQMEMKMRRDSKAKEENTGKLAHCVNHHKSKVCIRKIRYALPLYSAAPLPHPLWSTKLTATIHFSRSSWQTYLSSAAYSLYALAIIRTIQTVSGCAQQAIHRMVLLLWVKHLCTAIYNKHCSINIQVTYKHCTLNMIIASAF